jgi:cyclophilin family peptidyl-prolyl cis-trans isomerase
MLTKILTFFSLFLLLLGCSILKPNGKRNKKEVVLVETNYGNFKLKLYDQTPIHKKNFLALVDSGFYDSLLFHRIIQNFMVQAGDPLSKNPRAGLTLGNGGPGYTLKAEIIPEYIHKRGALAAARQGDAVNPEKRSSGSQFYIVTGRRYKPSDLKTMSDNIDHAKKVKYLQDMLQEEKYKDALNWLQYCQGARMSYEYDSTIRSFDPILEAYIDSVGHHEFTEEQVVAYSNQGGAPHLDGGYTVFGEVLEGMEVVELISKQKVDQFDRPINDVIILDMKRVKQ